MNQPLLEVCELTCSYPGKDMALRNVSLAVHGGERIALLGGNGAGKSTFFLAISGLLCPDAGQILLHGQEIRQNKADQQRLHTAVGLVFQEPDTQIIAPGVEAEVSFGPMNLGLSSEETASRVDAALSALDLEALRHRPPHFLSGGEKKRVTIADVLVMRPDLMLLDEPTASLDSGGTAALEENLRQLHESGISLMLATHDADFAWRWADRILVFADGALIADAAPEIIFNDQKIISRAGLALPYVFQLTQTLTRTGLIPALGPADLPRTPHELDRLLTQNIS